jgi:acetolactate synthase I/II/III large subunit
MTRAADLLARRLYDAGCRHAFGMPGGEVLTVVDALIAAGISFILCKHENNAGFMAEGVYHRTGAPGILIATLGPGVANCVNVVANAVQDRVPLIVLSGCVDPDEALTYTHQVFDHRALFEPITKATFTLSANGASIIADKAVAIATQDRPGPVFIDVPITVADAVVDKSQRPPPATAAPTGPAEGEALARARQLLIKAERPIMIAGLDVLNHNAAAAVRTFAETYNIPVVTTYKAKGIIPEDHPLALGGAGLSPKADQVLLPLFKEADLVLAVGYDPIEMRVGWRDPWNAATQSIVEFAAVENLHYMHRSTVSFVCDVGAGLNALIFCAKSNQTWACGQATEARRQLRRIFSSQGEWGPAAIVEAVRRVFPRDTIISVDSGAHRILLSQLWEAYEPRSVLQSSGLATMGCALPLAMGVKIAEPQRPVIAFSGDAGLLMVLGELSTLAELKIPITVVVFVDASLALIEMKQRARQLPNVGVDFAAHDFPAIARAFRGVGETVADVHSLDKALRAALSRSEGFTLIAAMVDRLAYDGRF